MKSRIILLSLLLVVTASISFYSCTKEAALDAAGSTTPSDNSERVIPNTPSLDNEGFLAAKPIIRLTWNGIEPPPGKPNPCGGGRCGICPGLCIKNGFRAFDPNIGLPDHARREGDATARVKLTERVLTVVPDFAGIDNGDGKVRVLEDYNIGPFARKFGVEKLIIIPGTYDIVYSPECPHGEVNFNVIVD